jgi:hypothetical protein
LQCFIPSDLTDGRPTDAAFREKLPWFLYAVPSADCAKGGHGAYSHSLDVAGLDFGVIRASEFRTYHTPMRKQTDFVEALRAAREFVDRASEKLKVRAMSIGKACLAPLDWSIVAVQILNDSQGEKKRSLDSLEQFVICGTGLGSAQGGKKGRFK